VSRGQRNGSPRPLIFRFSRPVYILGTKENSLNKTQNSLICFGGCITIKSYQYHKSSEGIVIATAKTLMNGSESHRNEKVFVRSSMKLF
jgi:hypothetical protein